MSVLNIVKKNFSFAPANEGNIQYQKMFPDFQVALKFFQEKTKLEYVLQLRDALFIKEQLMLDAHDVPYSFKFYESITSQSKRQYDTYITCYSLRKNLISYCGSLFVGHCTANQLLGHFLCL